MSNDTREMLLKSYLRVTLPAYKSVAQTGVPAIYVDGQQKNKVYSVKDKQKNMYIN